MTETTPAELNQEDPLLGTTFEGRFQILSVLGRGGMGMVYKARHVHMNKIVAIKTLVESAVFDDNSFLRFEQEARTASSLEHPNIIKIYDFGRSDQGLAYLVMEFIDGDNLEESIVETDGIELPEFRSIFSQVCDGMQHAHDKGIIHRDLKPSNIMLARERVQPDYVRIVDFGLAKLASNDPTQQLTQTGVVLGSPLYMSPENCRGDELDTRSDIYSLGCVMYAAASGHVPLKGKNSMATIYKHISDTPPPLSKVAADKNLPETLEIAIMRSLEKDPELRQQSMAELKAEIVDAIDHPEKPGKYVPGWSKAPDLNQTLPAGLKDFAGNHLIGQDAGQALRSDAGQLSELKMKYNQENAAAGRQSAPQPDASKKADRKVVVMVGILLTFLLGSVFFAPGINSGNSAKTLKRGGSQVGFKRSRNPGAAASSASGPAAALNSEQVQNMSQVADPGPAAAPALKPAQGQAAEQKAIAESGQKLAAAKPVKAIVPDSLIRQELSSEKSTALKLAEQFEDRAIAAYNSGNPALAMEFLKKSLAQEEIAYGRDAPELFETLAYIVAMLRHKPGNTYDSLAYLDRALKSFSINRDKAIGAISHNANTVWKTLALESLAVSYRERGPRKQTYAQWSCYFFDLLFRDKNIARDQDYYASMNAYLAAAMQSGELGTAQLIKSELMQAGQLQYKNAAAMQQGRFMQAYPNIRNKGYDLIRKRRMQP